MQTTQYYEMRPYIQMQPYPINSRMNDLEEDFDAVPLFHVIVSQGKLKMLFLVANHDPMRYPNTREYETIKCEYISLHGKSERDKYLGTVDNVKISADCTIVNEIFQWTLAPYSLKLYKANFHNFEFFESDLEGKGFAFLDSDKYEILKDLINQKCKLMMRNPGIKQY